jgi:2-isopropylmalate synthase
MAPMKTLPGELMFDWNAVDLPSLAPPAGLSFDDETLRDGLQSPSARHPTLEEKIRFLHLAAAVGVTSVDVGLPGAGARAAADAEALCWEIVRGNLPVIPNCAARATEADIQPILDMSQRVGRPIEVALFLASSPLRRHVEGWSLDEVLLRAETFVGFAVAHGAPVTFVGEDTSRSHPGELAALFGVAIRAGASRLCLADTAGQATPVGAVELVRYVAKVIRDAGGARLGIDWHGHNDRGLAVANALAAAWAGADRLHATALGVGERVGNPAIEQLLVNARLLGWAQPDLGRLQEYAEHSARMLGVTIPPGTPVVGSDAFRTSTGAHAAAILKAEAKGGRDLVDLVYSAIPAHWLRRNQEIGIGPMSGASNVRSWLAAHGHAASEGAIERIFAAAKQADRTLTDAELHALVIARSGEAVEE